VSATAGADSATARVPADVGRTFNLPTEKLAAQISSAADVALAAPGRYEALLEGLTGRRDLVASEVTRRAKPSSTDPGELSEAPYELAQLIRAGIDQLQISLGERWRRLVQGAALWIAGLYAIGLTAWADSDAKPRFIVAAVLVGGPFAWLVRDFAAVLERSRR
jgi:hypothetical protein